MPDIRNCPRCGKLFSYVRSPICPLCQEKDEEEYKVVKEYIYEHPGVNITIVAEETGVSVEKILRFLREERLELVSDSDNLILECERCKVPIRTGRYCEKCKNELANSFKKEFGIGASSGKKKEERMYTITRIKNR
jgi:flagellar operon protein (TIGR03826 family)